MSQDSSVSLSVTVAALFSNIVTYTANVYRDLQGLCREIGVQGEFENLTQDGAFSILVLKLHTLGFIVSDLTIHTFVDYFSDKFGNIRVYR